MLCETNKSTNASIVVGFKNRKQFKVKDKQDLMVENIMVWMVELDTVDPYRLETLHRFFLIKRNKSRDITVVLKVLKKF